MGIPLDIFTLHLLRGEETNCQHYLLLKVERPSFNNADEVDYARAVDAAGIKTRALVEVYETQALAGECDGPHAVDLVGELQSYPAGGEVFAEGGGFFVELWVARTRFGHPWVVMGTAESEEEFWRAVEQDDELSGLGAGGPAEKRRAYFLTEEGDATPTGGFQTG